MIVIEFIFFFKSWPSKTLSKVQIKENSKIYLYTYPLPFLKSVLNETLAARHLPLPSVGNENCGGGEGGGVRPEDSPGMALAPEKGWKKEALSQTSHLPPVFLISLSRNFTFPVLGPKDPGLSLTCCFLLHPTSNLSPHSIRCAFQIYPESSFSLSPWPPL